MFSFLASSSFSECPFQGSVGVGEGGKGKEKLNSNVPEPATATRPESLTKIGLWSEIGYSLA